MPELGSLSRRTRVAVWAGLCVAGLAATAGLNASSAPDPRPEKSVSVECAERIAEIEAQLSKAKHQSAGDGDGVLGFSRVAVGTQDDCRDEIRSHFGSDR
ncbi:hypothetical protein ACFWMX_34355 [Streptomyces sp. NPDC058378]|uniref:hypothetical protein n=1 Tax=unclassified Streptomyces TaxID=2593676 RepID=UPI00365B87A2